jgi:putative membrane protein
MVGGTYSYARVPVGFYLQDFFQLSRNPYDKVGHFFQGLVPALVIREILLRRNYLAKGKMLIFLVLFTVLGISAAYELLEWFSALVLGQGADEFLGTQGDPWDTQSDMFFALIGATTSLVSLSYLHDRQILQVTRIT